LKYSRKNSRAKLFATVADNVGTTQRTVALKCELDRPGCIYGKLSSQCSTTPGQKLWTHYQRRLWRKVFGWLPPKRKWNRLYPEIHSNQHFYHFFQFSLDTATL